MGRDDECSVCGGQMTRGDLDGNWREFECDECGSTLFRPVASDHGDGFSMEDLNDVASFTDSDS